MEIKRLELPLNENEIELYKKLTTEENYCYLHAKNPYHIQDLTYIALCAFNQGTPLGLLLATYIEGLDFANVRSLYVDEYFRGNGIGTKLLLAIEQELLKNHVAIVTMLYEADTKEALIFEHILKKCDWKPSTSLIERYYFKAAEFNPSWFNKKYQFPDNITLFPWEELTVADQLELKRREEQWNFPAVISPFLDVANIEYSNSFGLKKGERIIGWMIVHRLNESTIRYSCLYIQPEYQFYGLSIQLLIHSIKKNQGLIKEGYPAIWSQFDLNLEQTESSWQTFIMRRLKPFAAKTVIINRTWKELKE